MKLTITRQAKARCPFCYSAIDLHEITEDDGLYYNPKAYISLTLRHGKILAGICKVCHI